MPNVEFLIQKDSTTLSILKVYFCLIFHFLEAIKSMPPGGRRQKKKKKKKITKITNLLSQHQLLVT